MERRCEIGICQLGNDARNRCVDLVFVFVVALVLAPPVDVFVVEISSRTSSISCTAMSYLASAERLVCCDRFWGLRLPLSSSSISSWGAVR